MRLAATTTVAALLTALPCAGRALAAVVAPAVAGAPPAGAPACPPLDARPGPGLVDPFRPPDARATALNAAAKTPYRQGKWDEARAQYRAAEAADPDFLAPARNVACSFVRQERFVEATTEVLRLLDRAYVPWAREILTAADLGALKAQPQMAQVREAMAEAARRWGAHLEDDLLFVARQRAPLKLPAGQNGNDAGPVVLVLGLHQEVYAWSPATTRYRQLTAADGRVIAVARSVDRRRILYVTAEKLVRQPSGPATLRGVSLHALSLPTMAETAPLAVAGDVSRLAIVSQPAGGGFALDLEGDQLRGGFTLDGDGEHLSPGHRPDQRRAAAAGRLVVVTSAGVAAGTRRPLDSGASCQLEARPGKSGEGVPTIEIAPAGARGHGAPLVLRTRFGAGLDGLPIP